MSKLAVLAEIDPPVVAAGRPWGLRRTDLEALGAVRERLAGRRAVLVTGPPSPGARGAGFSAAAWRGDAEVAVATADAAGVGWPEAPLDPSDARLPAVARETAPAEAPTIPTPTLALAVGLAGVAAAAGMRTVLVECDVERPRLAADLGLDPVPGLHEYLRWEAAPADILRSLVPAGVAAADGAGPLACVCAGRPSDSPRTLLGLGSFRHMTAKLREAYELTILLGPPSEAAGGALEAVAAAADCSLAALAERPGRRAAKATHDALAWLPAPLLGAVVVTPAAVDQRS